MTLTRNTIIKIIELVLTLICFFLHYQTFEANDYHGLFITTGTYFAYIIILVGVFIGAFSGNPVNKSIVSNTNWFKKDLGKFKIQQSELRDMHLKYEDKLINEEPYHLRESQKKSWSRYII
ncbi:uncharacterized protein LOC113467860 isoform X2 [Diaphorina citri]|uniref:Uncharacterized protein LOC113467860 isoform X1 n=1 Tax=Diaphorina citri TaxID=121845 RepID=A0A3Q0IV13_DIACI|nr:uncharacterized protein LOC113467860 isoform X1 [Diaphorina citri]XP_026680110.1 uncharacterized protein LOC113467860 isoform X2 [Diaphorina citri]XP_026680111.1 uncharacterized protein LOC113467860 isoform X1 [Diaphorina citri]XP_026680112.1 uncharacterized protein LOC113467860 isoform X2 [Diaphorina citri]